MFCHGCARDLDLEERAEKIKKVIRRPAPKDGYICLTKEEVDDFFFLIEDACLDEKDCRESLEKSEKLIRDLTERVKWLEIELHNISGQKDVLTNELKSIKEKDF